MHLMSHLNSYRYFFWLSILTFSCGALSDEITPSIAQLMNKQAMALPNWSNNIKPHGHNLMGEEFDIASGKVQFQHIDIDIPGNSALEVAIRRTYYVSDTKSIISEIAVQSHFANWILEVPVISIPIYENTYPKGWANGRECTDNLFVEPVFLEVGFIHNYDKRPMLRVPGKTNSALLLPSDEVKALVGNEYRWVTKDKWRIKCDTSKAGREGFIANSPDGLTYFFNRRSRTSQPNPDELYVYISNTAMDNMLSPNSVGMLATRVEDKFGNSVSYEYDSSNRLTEIHSNDGRSIELNYISADSPRIDHITANGRTWRYEYNGPGGLSKVILPDGRSWTFKLYAVSGNVGYLGTMGPEQSSLVGRSSECSSLPIRYGINAHYEIHHPDGMVGNFMFNYKTHARVNMTAFKNVFLDSFSDCIDAPNLKTKILSENNQPKFVWEYNYSENWGSYINQAVGSESYLSDSDLPVEVDNLLHKSVTVINPDKTKTKYYINRDAQSAIEGSIKAIQYYDELGVKISTEIFDTQPGTDYGNVINPNPSNRFSPEITQRTIKKTHIYHYPQGNNKYYSDFYDFSVFDTPKYNHQYNDFSNEKRYIENQYVDDIPNWVLNLPTFTRLSSDGTNYTNVKEVTYKTISNSNNGKSYSVKVPDYVKRLGLWITRNVDYHADGNLKKVELNAPRTVGSGNRYQQFTSYKRGIPQIITLPARESSGSISETRVVDDNGWVIQATDFNGNVTNYLYDLMHRLTNITPADTRWSPTTISYATSSGYLSQTITRGNFRKKIQYDGLLRPILNEEWDNSNATATRRYTVQRFNAYNQPEFISYPSTSSTESQGTAFKYDGLQRLIQQYSTVDNKGVDYAYLAGNQIRTTDARGNSTTTTYRAFGSPSQDLPTKIEQPHGVTTDISYNLFNNITAISQGGITESRRYNAQQQLCRLARPDVGHTAYSYNALGQPVWVAQGASGGATACNEASVTAAQKVSYGYDNLGSLHTINYPDSTPDKTYTYDNQGNLKVLAAGTAVWDYTYNSANLIEEEVLTLNNISWITDPTYNAIGHVSTITYPSGKSVSYAPNALGQPTRVGNYATAASYYPNGQLKGFTYGNGLSFSQLLDMQQRPEYQTVKRNSSNVLNHRYQYDNNHNIDTISDLISPAKNIYLTYDDLDRLDTAKGFWGVGSFDYDELGNIKKKVLGNQNLTYAYNTSNRLTGISGNVSRTFAYDSRGNIINNGQRAFSFNLANQLITSGTNSYQYDGYNRRVKKVSNGKTQYSLYNAAGQLLMTDGDNGPTEYFYLGTKLIAKESHVLTSEDMPGYTGHLEDDDLQLTYMQQRYYDPVIGRFYSNDPVGFTASNPMMFNRYAYANNNPYKYVDPDGRTGVPFALTPMDKGIGPTGQQDLTLEQQAIGAAMVVGAAAMLVPDPTDAILAGAVSKAAVGRGQQVGRIIKSDGSTKASDIKAKAESVGFKPTQSGNGPLKMVDEKGTARVTIKGGSDRAPGSQGPHVELKDSSGQRVNPAGESVTRRSSENHTPIKNDL